MSQQQNPTTKLHHPQNDSISPENCTLVYFDLETSGFQQSADILQIAAKFDEHIFSIYVKPTGSISPIASRITGFENIAGELFLHGRRVDSITLREALSAFQQFLNRAPQPRCLLVAHNAPFDTTHFLSALHKSAMVDSFENIAGFSDTLAILRRRFPQRKGSGMFKLETLAHEWLEVNSSAQFHDAAYDVEILEKIVTCQMLTDDLFASGKSFLECLNRHQQSSNAKIILQTLEPLSGVLSKGMLRKIAAAIIDFEKLKSVYAEKGQEGIVELMSERLCDNKPRVTNSKKILESIVEYFSNHYDDMIILDYAQTR